MEKFLLLVLVFKVVDVVCEHTREGVQHNSYNDKMYNYYILLYYITINYIKI